MVRIVGVTLALMAATTAASAHDHAFETPRQVLGALYNAYVAGVEIRDFSPYFSARLTSEMNGRVIGQRELAELELEPIVGSSPWQINSFQLDVRKRDAAMAEVTVSFTNFGKPVSLSFELVKEPEDGWQIDHIEGSAGERTWCTDTIIGLAQGMAHEQQSSPPGSSAQAPSLR